MWPFFCYKANRWNIRDGFLVPPSQSLKTNGGLMYYNYDGMRNVAELTDCHRDINENELALTAKKINSRK